MKNRRTTIFLFISGLLLLGIGGTILLIPHAFHASNGIILGNDPNLLSEIRAPGGLLAGSAVMIILGAFRAPMRSLAIFLTIIVYGSFGLARLIGMAIDGMPSEGIFLATVIELSIAAIGYLIYRRRSDTSISSHKLTLSSEIS